MSGFSPSLEDARRDGIKVVRTPYPAGVAGVRLSLEQIAQRIREGALSPKVQGVAFDVLLKAGFNGRGDNAGSSFQRAKALLQFVRSTTLYAPDPPGVEYVKSAEALLCVAPGLCVRGGDCFPEETKLLRSDFKLIAIKDIRIGDRIWGHNAWTTVKRKWFSGTKTVDLLRLNNGSDVPLSPEHHVFYGACTLHRGRCHCDWNTRELRRIRLRDVEKGMVLPQPKAIDFGSTRAHPDAAYIEGLFLSEGWFDQSRFCISGLDGSRKEALKHEVKAICDRLGVPTRWHRKYIAVNSKSWGLELHELGSLACEKAARTLTLEREGAEALLRGIMSDSTPNTHGKGRTFSTTSPHLRTQVRVLQRMFGRSTGVRYLTPEQHGGFGERGLWRVGVRAPQTTREKLLRVKALERDVGQGRCYDITTEDGFVYLPEHDVTVSNCDDGVVLLGSLVMGVGIPVMVLKQTFGVGDQEHVLLEAQDDSGNWFALDPSGDMPAGSKATWTSEEFRLDPTNPTMIGLRGAPDAEFVGIGSLGRLRFVGDTAPAPTWTPFDIALGIVAAGIAIGAGAGLVQRIRRSRRGRS